MENRIDGYIWMKGDTETEGLNMSKGTRGRWKKYMTGQLILNAI